MASAHVWLTLGQLGGGRSFDAVRAGPVWPASPVHGHSAASARSALTWVCAPNSARRAAGLGPRRFLLVVLRPGSRRPQIGGGRAPTSWLMSVSSPRVLTWRRGEGLPRVSFTRTPGPFTRAVPPPMASASPQGLNPPKVRTRVTGSGPECLTWQVEGGIWESGNFKMLPGDAHRTGPGNPLFCRQESASILGPRLPVASVPGCPSSSLQRRSGASPALAHTGMLQKSTACVIGPDEALGQTPDGADLTDTQFILQQSSRTSLLRLKDIFSSRSR